MNRLRLAFLISVLAAAPSQAQADRTLLVTAFGGVAAGGDLWTVSSQPVSLLNTDLTVVGMDTFMLRRDAGPGLTVGVAATLFGSGPFGFGAEVSYTGPAERSHCAIVASGTPTPGSSEARGFNDDFCDSIDGQTDVLGAISLLAEFWAATTSAARTRPYLRIAAGLSDLAGSTADMSGTFFGPDITGDGASDFVDRPVMIDRQSTTVGATFAAGIGLMAPVSTGYFIRLEVRNQVFHRPVAIGPADVLANASVSKRWFHHPSIVIGLGLRMEQRAGRTYGR